MNLRDDDRVSAVALVVESGADVAEEAEEVAEVAAAAAKPRGRTAKRAASDGKPD